MLQYVIFYTVLMFLNNDFRLLQINAIQNGIDFFYYLWIILFFPIVDMLLFSVPIDRIFSIKSVYNFFVVMILILLLE